MSSFVLRAEYVNPDGLDETTDATLRKLVGRPGGAGYSFDSNVRDMTWYYETAEERDKQADKLNDARDEFGLKVTLRRYELP